MRKLYILTVLAALAAGGAGVSAETVSPDEARRVADEFLGVHTQPSRIVRHGAKGATAREGQPYYVFNSQAANGGFVIVSGNTGARKILGYSRTGRFDTDSIPPQVADLLDQYSRCLSTLPADAPAHSSWKEQEATPSEVVLTTAKWNQSYPFNEMCPEYPYIEGERYNSGCCPTATAIIMKYHKWPLKGEGQVCYEWDGKTITGDFSQSYYNWDMMKDNYYTSSSTPEMVYEISHFIYDVCTALKTTYGPYGTGASCRDACQALSNNFSYYDGIQELSLEYTSESLFFQTVKHEIDNKRPILFSSNSGPSGGGAHAFVGDGYNKNGYVHFNFGWAGDCDGFYSINPVEGFGGFDLEMYFGIQPTSRSKPDTYSLPPVMVGKFAYMWDGVIRAEYLRWKGCIQEPEIESGSVLQLGYVFEDTDIHTSVFSPQEKIIGEFDGGTRFYDIICYKDRHFNDVAVDGKYLLYPAYRINDEPWQKCIHSEFEQNHVELEVRNGEKFFTNLPPENNPVASGRVKVDNIYYSLDSKAHTAEVKGCNDLGKWPSYEGDIEIPSIIQVDGESYKVVSIGENAFDKCKLGNVILPGSIEILKTASFYSMENIKSINLSDLVNLKTIEGWSIHGTSNYCNFQDAIPPILPPNIESLGPYAIQLMDWPLLEIPTSMKYIARGLWNNTIDAIVFKHKDLSNLKLEIHSLLEYPDNGGEPSKHLTVFVPAGMKEDYLAYHDIQKCEVVEYTGEVVLPSDVSFMAEGKTYSDGETVGMAANGTIRLQPVFYPGNTTMTNVKWEYPEEYFSMDAEGNLKYLGNAEQVSEKRGVDGIGEALTRSSVTTAVGPIVARTLDGSRLTRQFYVDIYPDTESVSLDVADKTLSNGEKFRLTATVTPEDAAGTIHWTSSNSTVATVSQEGEVMAMAPGTAVITATAADGSGVSASCEVTVSGGTVGVPMTGVDLNEPIEVYDAAGTCVYKGNAGNLPALGKGFYIMTVRDRRIKVMR